MHDNVNDVVHVEDHLVTWANFFSVLKWGIGPNYLSTRDAVYTSNDSAQLTFILNGKKVADIANTVVEDQDKLLVNFGNQSNEDIQNEFNSIQNKAKEADNSKDPVGCGGSVMPKTTMRDRMGHLF